MLSGRHIAVIAFVLAAPSADAQTISSSRRTFVDVTLGPDWDDAYSSSTRVPGATWRYGFAFGFDWGRSGIELDVGVPQWHVKHLGPQRYVYGGPSFGWQQQGHFYEWSSTVRRRSSDVTVFYRRNMPVNGRVTFSWLAGAGHVSRPEQYTGVTNEVLPDGRLTEVNVTGGTSFRNYLAATAGLDAEFRIAPRVSVVPRLRVTAFPSFLDDSGMAPRPLIARPEIAVRWRF